MPDRAQPQPWDAAAEAPDPLIGQEVSGAYRILTRIGTGGMGSVYEARHTRLNKRVAVKVLNHELAGDPTYMERFRREAEVTSKLKHRHICEVVDFNTLPDGSPYMVMEYLDGEDLAGRIKNRGPLSPAELAPIIEAVASALGAAHKIGVLHRDVKPANIFLAKIDGAEVAKLLDFGAAKQKGHDSNLTAFGQVLGSVHYVSPEQARGQELDPRTDVFSLGIVMYEALTGHNPFEAETPNDTLFKIVGEAPPPLRNFSPAATPQLEEVLSRALAKRREERYGSMAELAEAAVPVLDPGRRRKLPAFTPSRPMPAVAEPVLLGSPIEPVPLTKPLAAPAPDPLAAQRLASLQQAGMLGAEALREAQGLERAEGELVFDRLVEAGRLEERTLLRHWVGASKLKYLTRETLAKSKVPADALAKLAAPLAERLCALPVAYSPADGVLTVATADPAEATMEKVRAAAKVAKAQPILALAGTVRAGIRRFYFSDTQAFTRPEPRHRPASPPPPPAPPAPPAPPRVEGAPAKRPGEDFDTLPPQRAAAEALGDSDTVGSRATTLAGEPSDAVIEGPLLAAKLVEKPALEQARALWKQRGGLLADALLRLNLVREVDFLRTFAELYGVRFVKSDKVTKVAFAQELLDSYPVREAERLRVLPFSRNPSSGEAHVIAAVPLDPEASASVAKHTKASTVTIYLATPGAVQAALRRWYYGDRDVFEEVSANGAGPAPAVARSESGEIAPGEPTRMTAEPTRVAEAPPEVVAEASAEGEADTGERPAEEEGSKTVQFAAMELPERHSTNKVPLLEALALDFQRRLTLEPDAETMVKVALSALLEVFPSVGAALQRTGGEAASVGLRAELKEAFPQTLAEAAHAAKTPVLVAEVGRDDRYGHGLLARTGKVKSAAAVALRGRDRELGVLLVDSSQVLGPPELKLLSALADLTALRLEDVERLDRMRARDRDRWRLQRFLPPGRLSDVLNGLVPAVRPDGHQLETTLLFAKLRGVSALAERLPAREVMAALNGLWGELAKVIADHGGCVERIQGEGLMALWSPDIGGRDDAPQAVKAALKLAALAPKLEVGGKPLAIRVGVHSGPVALGLVGPEGRKDWSAIGPPVRLAAKLCAMALEGQVLCSQATVNRAGPALPAKPIPLQPVEGVGPGSQMAYLVGASQAEEISLDI